MISGSSLRSEIQPRHRSESILESSFIITSIKQKAPEAQGQEIPAVPPVIDRKIRFAPSTTTPKDNGFGFRRLLLTSFPAFDRPHKSIHLTFASALAPTADL